jgi:hypothetical protein
MLSFCVFRDKTKNNVPKLAIIFSLIKANSLKYNGLHKKDLTQSKGNRIVKLGRLFFVLSLNETQLLSTNKIVCQTSIFSLI